VLSFFHLREIYVHFAGTPFIQPLLATVKRGGAARPGAGRLPARRRRGGVRRRHHGVQRAAGTPDEARV